MNDIEKQIDSYIKRTIINSVKDFKKYEIRKFKNEVSIDELSQKFNNNETALLSYEDKYAVFYLNLEDNMQDENLYKIIKKLSKEQKEILTWSILDKCTSKEIAEKLNKSDSRIRNIIKETIAKIKSEYEEKE